MENLVDFWRAKPYELRQAIRSYRSEYRTKPKSTSPPDTGTNLLVGAGDDGATLLGAVITDQSCDSEITKAFQEVRGFIQSQPKPEPGNIEQLSVRLQFFLPPDAMCGASYSGVQGVPVEWFQWVPVDEHYATIQAYAGFPLTRAEGNVETTIARLLGHLKWWEQAIRTGTASEPPTLQAILVHNAATLLEWHFSAPGIDPREHFRDVKARTSAKNAIQTFMSACKTYSEKSEGKPEAKVAKTLGVLADAVAAAVTNLSTVYACPVSPVRVVRFEEPIKPWKLLEDWLAVNGHQASDEGTSELANTSTPGLAADSKMVLDSLLPAFAAQKLFDEGNLSAEAYTGVRQTCADWLEHTVALIEWAKPGADSHRWAAVGKPAIRALRRPVAPRLTKTGAP